MARQFDLPPAGRDAHFAVPARPGIRPTRNRNVAAMTAVTGSGGGPRFRPRAYVGGTDRRALIAFQ